MTYGYKHQVVVLHCTILKITSSYNNVDTVDNIINNAFQHTGIRKYTIKISNDDKNIKGVLWAIITMSNNR